MKPKISIQQASEGPSPSNQQLQHWCQQTLQHLQQPGELTIRVVDEAEMIALNQQYRGKAGSTNVLSFPQKLAPGINIPLLGDIVICAAVVNREAAIHDNFAQHWAHMVVHGTLHLLGFDHHEEEEAAVMEGKEIAILANLGFTNPYEVSHDG